MAPSNLKQSPVIRPGSSIDAHQQEEFAQPSSENPLEVGSSNNKYPAASNRQSPNNHEEPPPPYEAIPSQQQSAPAFIEDDGLQVVPVEHTSGNSSQWIAASYSQATEDLPEISQNQPEGSPAISTVSSHAPLSGTPLPPNNSAIRRRPVLSGPSSSDVSRPFGDEKRPPTPKRTFSASSSGGMTILSPLSSVQHIREQGKFHAYLVPFPKPTLKGVKPEDVPERFLIYSPPLPPLSKPADGEKETHWHKARRQWQEDVRKAIMQETPGTTWKGMKAKSSLMLRQGVTKTMSSTAEFLDRASGTFSYDEDSEGVAQSPNPSTKSITELPETSSPIEQNPSAATSSCAVHNQSASELSDKAAKKYLEELTLVYPPALELSPEDIRTEFVSALTRSREKSMKDTAVSSSLLPVAAALDASLIVTLGGLTGSAAAWAYTSVRNIKTSNEISKGISLSEEQANPEHAHGCTCGHHKTEFGPFHITRKEKKNSINLRLQQSPSLDLLRHYLYLACADKEFSMFPHAPFTETRSNGAVDEEAVLRTIGWKPTPRRGKDLEIEIKGKTQALTAEQDMALQVREAREDVKRIFKKAAVEWITWCKNFQKDPKEAVKK